MNNNKKIKNNKGFRCWRELSEFEQQLFATQTVDKLSLIKWLLSEEQFKKAKINLTHKNVTDY